MRFYEEILGDGYIEVRYSKDWKNPSSLFLKKEDFALPQVPLPHEIHFSPVGRLEADRKAPLLPRWVVWADMDEGDEETHLRLCDSLKLRPNWVGSSGYGTTLWWLLTRPVEEHFKDFLTWIGADVGAGKPGHLMRAPGSFNCKTLLPRECKVRRLHGERFDPLLFSNFNRPRWGKPKVTSFEKISSIPENTTCPLLRAALEGHLPYRAWCSLACYLTEEEFHRVSALDRRYKQEETQRVYESVRDYKGWSCKETEFGSCHKCPGIRKALKC